MSTKNIEVFVEWDDEGDKFSLPDTDESPALISDLRSAIYGIHLKGSDSSLAAIQVFSEEGGRKLKYNTELRTLGQNKKSPLYIVLPRQETKKQKTMLDVAKADGCSRMKAPNLVDLKKAVEMEDRVDVHEEPNANHEYIQRDRELEELKAALKPVLEATSDHKKAKLVVEYATISGAGKTRWMFNAFKDWKGQVADEELDARVVHWNFNGADDSNDCRIAARKETEPEEAIARLLLSRGLLECDPNMKWMMGGGQPLLDEHIPKKDVIVDAIFQSAFKDGKGLLVVHLDELSFLRDARLESEPKDKEGKVTDAGRANVILWMKDFMNRVASLSKYEAKRFVVAVITHTSPSGRIIGKDSLSKVQYEPLRLYPFTLDQSWKLLNAARKRQGLKELDSGAQVRYEPLVALAGGHPWLLLAGFKTTLITIPEPPAHASVVNSSIVALVQDERLKHVDMEPISSDLAREFVEAVLKRKEVSDQTNPFQEIYDAGLAWYLPLVGQRRRVGHVSAPFPHLLELMTKAGGAYATLAQQLDPTHQEYEPTKAMEYVAALSVLLNEQGNAGIWANIAVPHGMSFEKIQEATEPFLTVWTSKTEATTDFGGKCNTDEGLAAIVGQVKMQKEGHETVQDIREVMRFAWNIGRKVNGPVHAFFVSSHQAPSDLSQITTACRIAMSGDVKEGDAEAFSLKKHGPARKGATVANIRRVCNDLIEGRTSHPRCQFTYIGKNVQGTGPFKEMVDLLPHGIFANW